MRSSRWRSVSTTSIAIINSSSVCGFGSTAVSLTIRPYGPQNSMPGRQKLCLGSQTGDAPLAILDGFADLGRVLRGELAHLVDDLARALLEIDDAVDELLDGICTDRGAVAGPQRLFLDLVSELGEVLETLRHPLLHGFERLGRLVQPENAGERRLQRRQHAVVRREERNRLRIDPLLGGGGLHQAS